MISVIRAKAKVGVSLKVSVSSCQTRSIRMSLARSAVRTSPPARIADQDPVPRKPVDRRRLREAAEHADAEVIVDATVGVCLPAEFAARCTDIASRQHGRREKSGECG